MPNIIFNNRKFKGFERAIEWKRIKEDNIYSKIIRTKMLTFSFENSLLFKQSIIYATLFSEYYLVSFENERT